MLVLDRVSKIYPNGVNALERFSAEIRLGEIVAIIGGSGCGKSTLLRAIAGLDRATSGSVTLDEVAIAAPHAKIGIIFQEPRLLPWLSVADNIGFGLSDLPGALRRDKVAGALARVGLADKANAWPRELSGGQAQRVAIARALVPQPEVLLWTSRSPRSMPLPAATCRTICSICGPTPGPPWFWSRMTSMKPWCWPIASLSCGHGPAGCSRRSPSIWRGRATATRNCSTISNAGC